MHTITNNNLGTAVPVKKCLNLILFNMCKRGYKCRKMGYLSFELFCVRSDLIHKAKIGMAVLCWTLVCCEDTVIYLLDFLLCVFTGRLALLCLPVPP